MTWFASFACAKHLCAPGLMPCRFWECLPKKHLQVDLARNAWSKILAGQHQTDSLQTPIRSASVGRNKATSIDQIWSTSSRFSTDPEIISTSAVERGLAAVGTSKGHVPQRNLDSSPNSSFQHRSWPHEEYRKYTINCQQDKCCGKASSLGWSLMAEHWQVDPHLTGHTGLQLEGIKRSCHLISCKMQW